MDKNTVRQWINVLAFLLMVVVNGLANALPLNGQTTGEISDRFAVYFVPAGYVFAIWGVIYVGLLAFTIYQALPAQRENPRLIAVGYLFAGSCLANIAWLFLWHYNQFELTLVAMLALLVTLITSYLRLGIGKTRVSTAETWSVQVPLSIYLGWITVATIANATSLLEYLGWGGWGIPPQTWAVIMLAVASAVATAISLTRRDVAYLLVLVWAFAGIAVKHAETNLVTNSAWAATAFAGLLALIALYIGFRGRGRITG